MKYTFVVDCKMASNSSPLSVSTSFAMSFCNSSHWSVNFIIQFLEYGLIL